MSDASHPPVDGAEPRSAPDPVADPPNPGPAGGPEADLAPPLPERGDGEAMPPAEDRADWDAADPGVTDVAAGAGIGGTEADGGDGDQPTGSGEAAIDPADRPAAAEPEPADLDVSSGAGIGGPDDTVTQGASQTEPAASAGRVDADAPAEQPAPVVDEGAASEAGAEPAAEQPAAAVAEPTPAQVEPPAEAPAPAAAAPEEHAGHHPTPPGATHAPTLPPPPPELAEVPSDAGHVVSGRVREVGGDDVVVDLEDGRVGVINRRNLGLDGDPSAALSVGDPIEGAVLARSDPQHRVVLSRTWALKKRAWEAVAAAAAEGAPLTGKVVSVGQKGVVVDVGVRGFVPASHLELAPVTDLQPYAGQELTLRVLDVDVDRERLVLSRRSLLLKEQRRSLHDVLSALQPGEVRRGRVASLSDYGAFVDLGGVNGLVHLSELSWQRVRHPSEVVSVGDEVDVKVLDVKVKKRRVSLSIRQLSDDPLGSLVPGEIRSGPVTRLVDFGAFVDLSGVEGLVHLSELAEYRVSAPEEIVAPGEEVRVKVLSVDRRRRRVELSIRQAAEYGG